MFNLFNVSTPRSRDNGGKFAKKADETLVNVTVTNPFTYLKNWWSRVMANEGVDMRFRIHPLTAFLFALSFGFGGFSIHKWTVPVLAVVGNYIPAAKDLANSLSDVNTSKEGTDQQKDQQTTCPQSPQPVPNPTRETAFNGILKQVTANKKFYLVTREGEAITLDVPQNVDLKKYIGKRMFAAGNWNDRTGILAVTDAQDLEILPTQITPVPTIPGVPATPLTSSSTPSANSSNP